MFVLFLKKNQSTPRASEHPPVMGEKMSKRLGGIKGCKYKFCFVFRLYAFVEAAGLRSIVLRYAGVPIVIRVSFFFLYLEMSLFPSIFSALSLYGECFSYLVTMGWIFDISLCENSINQSIRYPNTVTKCFQDWSSLTFGGDRGDCPNNI